MIDPSPPARLILSATSVMSPVAAPPVESRLDPLTMEIVASSRLAVVVIASSEFTEAVAWNVIFPVVEAPVAVIAMSFVPDPPVSDATAPSKTRFPSAAEIVMPPSLVLTAVNVRVPLPDVPSTAMSPVPLESMDVTAMVPPLLSRFR